VWQACEDEIEIAQELHAKIAACSLCQGKQTKTKMQTSFRSQGLVEPIRCAALWMLRREHSGWVLQISMRASADPAKAESADEFDLTEGKPIIAIMPRLRHTLRWPHISISRSSNCRRHTWRRPLCPLTELESLLEWSRHKPHLAFNLLATAGWRFVRSICAFND
jgi:hypothetical protein